MGVEYFGWLTMLGGRELTRRLAASRTEGDLQTAGEELVPGGGSILGVQPQTAGGQMRQHPVTAQQRQGIGRRVHQPVRVVGP